VRACSRPRLSGVAPSGTQFTAAVENRGRTFRALSSRHVPTIRLPPEILCPFQVLLIPYPCLADSVHCACGDLISNVDMPNEADGTTTSAYAQSIDRRGKLLGIADLLATLASCCQNNFATHHRYAGLAVTSSEFEKPGRKRRSCARASVHGEKIDRRS
jgi:hypothetical protein